LTKKQQGVQALKNQRFKLNKKEWIKKDKFMAGFGYGRDTSVKNPKRNGLRALRT